MSVERKELFSETVSAGSRTYFFDVRRSKEGALYLVISESRQVGAGHKHHRVMVFEENLKTFCEGFEKAIAFLDVRKRSNFHSLDEIRQKYSKAYEKWSPEEDEQLKQKRAEGMSISDLAKHFQRQPSAIRSRLSKSGL